MYFGNDAETLKRAKDPLALARVCAANGVRHPQIAFAPPDEPERWLIKRRGGAGGAHVAAATGHEPRFAGLLFSTSRQPAGASPRCSSRTGKKPKSLASACNGPRQRRRRRFDMAAPRDPSTSAPPKPSEIARSVAIITSELGLVGLNSVDFLVSDEAVWLIEINPRPGATLDVFESNEDPLFARHVAACEGRLTRTPPTHRRSKQPRSFMPLAILS